MKRELVNFVAVIGLVLLGAAVVLGVLTGILFIFPKASIMGARAVNERNTQIIYCDEALKDAFANGNFILESSGTRIEVQTLNQGDGRITVEESATGIAFNSLNRTLIEWTQTLYHGELYYRIKVLEPSGMVFKQSPTVVYIDLPHRDDDFRYNFVLQNKYSPVNFSFIDKEVPTDSLLLDTLVVESAASVIIPYDQKISVNNISIKGNNTKFTCGAQVLNNVFVTGDNNHIELGNKELTGIAGNVTISGENNNFSGTSANGVTFKANKGSLNMSQTIASLEVETVAASINAKNVAGAVNMTTQSGNLQVDSVGGNLTFTAGTTESPYATASLNVGKVNGAVVVENYGTGSVDLNNVSGDVSVKSTQVDGGAINIGFAEGASGHVVDILGYDGDINVRGINGGTVDIKVFGERSRAGAANINAQFKKVGTAEIHSGGYVDGHDDWGNVNIALADSHNALDLYVFYARSANSSAKYGYNESNMNISDDESNLTKGRNHINGGSGSTGTLKIYSQNKVYLS